MMMTKQGMGEYQRSTQRDIYLVFEEEKMKSKPFLASIAILAVLTITSFASATTVWVDTYNDTSCYMELVGSPIGTSPQGFSLQGNIEVNVFFEGDEGDADDDDGDGRDEVQQELVAMNLTGDGLILALNSAQQTLGQIEELTNNTPGYWDLDPFGPGDAESFFDIFFEIEVGGGLVLHNDESIRMEAIIDQMTDEAAQYLYILPGGPIELLDAANDPSGIYLTDGWLYTPEPATLSLLALGGLTVLRKRRKQ